MNNLQECLSRFLSAEESKAVAQAATSGLPIIIDGIQGPTGKSTLCREIRELGLTAAEKYEADSDKNKDNHNGAYIVIVLNKPFDSP